MAIRFETQPFSGPLAARLATRGFGAGLRLYWLGQAGFLLRGGGLTLLVDPYLSDSLAEKYRGTALPHRRMMPAPIEIADLPPVDLVLCTHAHTDHMDPGTLRPLLARQPGARILCPRAKRQEASARGDVPFARIVDIEAGETCAPLPGLEVAAVRAAHEDLARDETGNHLFLALHWHNFNGLGALVIPRRGFA
jgi:L-ascorbate metabolism protein UlaG (beta-lactamase superfamily)